MPRILLTGFFGVPGPARAGVQMRHVMRALSRHHEVDVLAVREPEQAHMERVGTVRILRVPVAEEGLRPRVEAFRRALRRQIAGADYDVVHFRDGWSGQVVLELRGQHGYQTVFDATRAPIAEPPLMDLSLGAELARSEEICMAAADHVLVPSPLARDHVLERRSRGVHIVPAGVDVDLFDWDDLPPGPPMVLYAGAVEPGRGLRGLLRAMATVAQRSEATLAIAGRAAPGPARTLLDTAAELGLRDRVELLGEIAHENMPELIARATVCVAPSAVELSAQPMAMVPTKVLEYMACRRAVVAPVRGSVATVIEDGANGMLFQPGNPRDMAHKLLALLYDPDLRERLAGAGYHLVREYYTASAMRRALRRAYAAMQIRDTRPHHALDESTGQHAGQSTGQHAGGSTGQSAPEPEQRASAAIAHRPRSDPGEAERTDQMVVPFPGLPAAEHGATGDAAPPGEADATDIDLARLEPASADRERPGTRDTEPALLDDRALDATPAAARELEPGSGARSGRASSGWDTFEMPALKGPARPAPSSAPAPAPDREDREDRDYRAVSGEVEVRAPAPGERRGEDGAPAAASVLLGGSKDAGE